MCINMTMIYACPNCGNSLPKPLQDGICICTYCNVLFDSSAQSRLLAAAWIVRKKNYTFDQMKDKLKLSDQESEIIEQKINIDSLNHDEFIVYLREIKVPNRCYMS